MKRALIIVDAQGSFVNERNRSVVSNIARFLSSSNYDLYVEANFHAEKGSLWDRQQSWICPEGPETQTVPELADLLAKVSAVKVRKETRSVFKGDVDLAKLFREKGIQEVHLVGFDTNDCVLATAFESFDLGFPAYAIEDCCQSADSDELHEAGLKLLRWQGMLIGK